MWVHNIYVMHIAAPPIMNGSGNIRQNTSITTMLRQSIGVSVLIYIRVPQSLKPSANAVFKLKFRKFPVKIWIFYLAFKAGAVIYFN
jgi:hypothetical protein